MKRLVLLFVAVLATLFLLAKAPTSAKAQSLDCSNIAVHYYVGYVGVDVPTGIKYSCGYNSDGTYEWVKIQQGNSCFMSPWNGGAQWEWVGGTNLKCDWANGQLVWGEAGPYDCTFAAISEYSWGYHPETGVWQEFICTLVGNQKLWRLAPYTISSSTGWYAHFYQGKPTGGVDIGTHYLDNRIGYVTRGSVTYWLYPQGQYGGAMASTSDFEMFELWLSRLE